MTVTLNIPEETLEIIKILADSANLTVEQYLASLVRTALPKAGK